MLHSFESPDHRFDAAAHLLVLVQQSGALSDEGILPLPQRLILFLKLAADDDELFESFFQAFELEVEAVIGLFGGHAENIEP